jgi:large subunit ribosomal protein L23
MDLKDVLKKPLVTEKTNLQMAQGKYTFQVDRRATKKEVALAVAKTFGVHVQRVQAMMVPGKKKRMLKTRKETQKPDWKKTTVKLKEGEKIDLFETGE